MGTQRMDLKVKVTRLLDGWQGSYSGSNELKIKWRKVGEIGSIQVLEVASNSSWRLGVGSI